MYSNLYFFKFLISDFSLDPFKEKSNKTIFFRGYNNYHFPPPTIGGGGGSSQQHFSTIFPPSIMERGGGLDNISDTGLCLQDLVGGGGGTSNNGGGGGGGGSGNDHLHNHHSLHDSVAAAVSVSSAITGLMPGGGGGGSGLSHLHHSTHDVGAHHHHGVVPHSPTVLHEPLEKLKSK